MEEEQTINTYELTLLIDSDLSEFDLKKVIDKVKALIASNKGNLVQEHSWGKKQLAYLINKKDFGFYHTLIMELPAETIEPITKDIQLNSKIIRYLLISLNKEGVTLDQLFTPEKEEAMVSSSVKEKLTPEPKIKEIKKPIEKLEKIPKADEATRQKELDKKIDELLKTDDKEEEK